MIHGELTARRWIDAGVVHRFEQHTRIDQVRPIAADGVAVQIVAEDDGYGIAHSHGHDTVHLPAADHAAEDSGLSFTEGELIGVARHKALGLVEAGWTPVAARALDVTDEEVSIAGADESGFRSGVDILRPCIA